MSTIATSSASPIYQWPGQSYMDRDIVTGHLYVLVRIATTQFAMYKSTNNGTSWAATGSTITRANLIEVSGIVVNGPLIHMA